MFRWGSCAHHAGEPFTLVCAEHLDPRRTFAAGRFKAYSSPNGSDQVPVDDLVDSVGRSLWS